MKEKEEEVIWSRSNGSLFKDFAISLEEYTQTGKTLVEGDQDIQYGLELQNKHLQKKGLSMLYKFVPRGHFPGGMKQNKGWKDEHYTSTLHVRTCRMERSLYKGSKKEHKDKENMTFVQTITDVNTPQLIRNDVHNCPNYGAPVSIGELQSGCPYCSSHFEISDIFPKVSNYYFYKDPSMTEKENGTYMVKFMIGCAVLFFIYGTLYSIINTDSPLISIVIIQVVTSIFGGVVMGYFFASLALLGKVFHNAGKTLCLLPSMGTGVLGLKTFTVNGEMNFSIRHLQCKGCGISFDATKEKHCPSCGTEYNLTTEDWVVTKIVRLKVY